LIADVARQEAVKMTRLRKWITWVIIAALGAALQGAARADQMPVSLKTFVTMDITELQHMIDRNINTREANDEVYDNQLAEVLAFRILPHPSFSVRSAGISHLALKISESNEWAGIYEKAAHKLIAAFNNAKSASDKATTLAGLVNLVTEVRPKSESYRGLLEEIKNAHLVVPQDAADYARDPMRHLVSPSDEAALALNY